MRTTTPTTPAPTTAGRALASRRQTAVTGLLAVLGGLAWTAGAVLHASQPTGCVAEECLTTQMREATPATAALVGLSGLLLLASGAGLVLLVRRAGALGRLGQVGAGLCASGIATLGLGVAIQELAYDGDFPHMPAFVGPGLIALALGAVLLGLTIVRSPVVPVGAGAALIAGAVLLVLANEQTAAVLFAVPFGLAWAATGAALLWRR